MTGLPVAEIARTYGRSQRTLRRLLDQGVVPHTKNPSGHRLVTPQHVPALVAAAQRAGEAPKKLPTRFQPNTTDLEWHDLGACREADPELFFPDHPTRTQERDAKDVCMACSVLARCRNSAITNDERWGIWGGLTAAERKRIRARRTQKTKKAAA